MIVEKTAGGLALALMALLPLAEMLSRTFLGGGIPGSGPFVQHLTLWVGFLGAALAAREGKLLALATGTLIPKGPWRRAAQLFASAVTAAVSTLLCIGSVELVVKEKEFETTIAAGVPVWLAQTVLPLSFSLIALRLVWRASASWKGRMVAGSGILAGLVLGFFPNLMESVPPWSGVLVVIAATLLGGPIFAALGGIAVLLFMCEGVAPAAVPVETYRLAVSPMLPSIPLFTLTGFILARGQASQRLLRVFRAFFGWIPGGTAVVCALVCAFFTVPTGGSGVTILALGGLLFQALRQDSYSERFSLGLLTASGSLGLLFPPALPLILYGIVAQVSIEDLFIGGIVPGILLVSLVAAWGIREGCLCRAGRSPFDWREAGRALWVSKWELLLPVAMMVAIFGGFATLVEASALSALYALAVQCFIVRDIRLFRDVAEVLQRCLVLVGGVLIILGVAMGLSSYLVDAQVPAQLLDWAKGSLHSPLVFLLCLNVFLLVVGCLLDIFSATVVVVPLIVPIGLAFGINPIHLGIIFVANLELGYLTPPVGLNLFLASYRFERPLLAIYRATLPMLVILAFGVLVITYVPILTTGLLTLLGRQ